jgi:LacI family transcriptional regulator
MMQNLPRILLSIENSRGFGRDLLTGISDFTRLYNPWAVLRKPPFFREGERELSNLKVIKSGVDGIITRVPEEIPIAQKAGIPAIFATTLFPKNCKLDKRYPIITCDPKAIAEMAVNYFIGQGFKNLAYCGFGEITWSVNRRHVFCNYAKEMGYHVFCYDQVSNCGWNKEMLSIADWLGSLPKPIGILACSDDRGEEIIEAAKIANVKIPEEVAVMGIDNDSLACNLLNPTLSSIALNTQAIGYEAAELLYKLIKGEEKMKGQQLVISPKYIEIRQSTNILAIEDLDVASAVGFIRQKTKEAIQVQDVVNVTSASRRVLEGRFRKVLGRSILQEIRRVRVETIAKLVSDTNVPIKSIAVSLGFASVDHISRYFKKEKNMSLRRYRQQYGRK